eukprot:751188-Hanusia_phi.AAC.1
MRRVGACQAGDKSRGSGAKNARTSRGRVTSRRCPGAESKSREGRTEASEHAGFLSPLGRHGRHSLLSRHRLPLDLLTANVTPIEAKYISNTFPVCPECARAVHCGSALTRTDCAQLVSCTIPRGPGVALISHRVTGITQGSRR